MAWGPSSSTASPKSSGPPADRTRRGGCPESAARRSGVLADLHMHRTDTQKHLLAKVTRRLVLSAGAGHQGLHQALEVVLLQARCALVQMPLDLRTVRVLHLPVEEEEDPLQ